MFSGHVWIPPIPRATFRATSSSTSETRCKLPAYKAWKILRQSTKCVVQRYPKILFYGYMAKNHENTTEHRWNTHSNTNIWNKQSWRHIIHKSRVCVDTTVIIPQNIVGLQKKTWNLSSMIWLDSFKFHFFGTLLQPLYLLVLQMSIILAGVAALEIKPGHTLSIRCSQSCCATKPRQTTDSFNKQSASTYMQIPGMTGWMFAVNDWQIFIILIIHTDKNMY